MKDATLLIATAVTPPVVTVAVGNGILSIPVLDLHIAMAPTFVSMVCVWLGREFKPETWRALKPRQNIALFIFLLLVDVAIVNGEFPYFLTDPMGVGLGLVTGWTLGVSGVLIADMIEKRTITRVFGKRKPVEPTV